MNKWINRPALLARLEQALRRSRIVALLGPRQCGKSTLAGFFTRGRKFESFDLERHSTLARLRNPEMVLEPLRGLVIIDEVQLLPSLFPLLRVLADRRKESARFLILGSASPELIRHMSESLAGRVEFVMMGGFTSDEVGKKLFMPLWSRGGFPRSYLAKSDADSFAWRENFIQTFLERDMALLGVRIPPEVLRRFWIMMSHCHGNIWNASEIGGSLGVSYMTARHYLDLLTHAYMVRQLQPWHENIAKRQVKSPKVYIRDSGLLHCLLGLRSFRDIQAHPKFGFSWEGFVIEEILRHIGERNAYFWASYSGAELDLLVIRGRRKFGIECKCSDAPEMTKSMSVALESLKLDQLYVIYPGDKAYPVTDRVTVVPLHALNTVLKTLTGSQFG